MILKIYEGVVINAKTIVSIIPRYESKEAIYADPEYSGILWWKKEVKPRREIKPKEEKFFLKLTFIRGDDGRESWLEWTDKTEAERDIRAKHLTEIAMSFDTNYVNKVFEEEVLR